MTTVNLIPTIPSQQTFSITLSGVVYTMRLIYCDDPEGGWILDLGDGNGNPILCGIPLKYGVNFLAQYEYLAIGGALVIDLQNSITTIGYNDLGVNAQIYYLTP